MSRTGPSTDYVTKAIHGRPRLKPSRHEDGQRKKHDGQNLIVLLGFSACFASRSAFVVFFSLARRLAARCFSACRLACGLLLRFAGALFFAVFVFFAYLPATLSPNYSGGSEPPSIEKQICKARHMPRPFFQNKAERPAMIPSPTQGYGLYAFLPVFFVDFDAFFSAFFALSII